MLYNYFKESLIRLKELIVKEIKKNDNPIHIYGELEKYIFAINS